MRAISPKKKSRSPRWLLLVAASGWILASCGTGDSPPEVAVARHSLTIPAGKTIFIRAAANGKLVTAQGGDHYLFAYPTQVTDWERFLVEDRGGGNVALKCVANGKYVSADLTNYAFLIANRDVVGGWETFTWIDLGNSDFALKALATNKYVSSDQNAYSLLIANRDVIGGWETFSATISDAGFTAFNGVQIPREPGYDYAPSVMGGDGPNIKMWWCGRGPQFDGDGDVIYYSEYSASGWSTPQKVFEPDPNIAWDVVNTCDPSVIKGAFQHNGHTYPYALYYTGQGVGSGIGLAFSDNGTSWVRYGTTAIIPAAHPELLAQGYYGAGMQTVHRNPSTGLITMAFFDSTRDGLPGFAKNFMATSTDGKTFTNIQALPTPIPAQTGADQVAVGDIAWDPATNTWLVVTKWNTDFEIYIYRTSNSSLTSPWNTVGSISPTTTGKTYNHNPAWLRWTNGDIYTEPSTGYRYIYFGSGNDSAGLPNVGGDWDIAASTWIENGWEFNSTTEGWNWANLGTTPGSDGSKWNFTTPYNDPYVYSRNIEAYAAILGKVQVSLLNTNAATDGRIYFRTDSENYYDELKSVAFTVPGGGTLSTQTVTMNGNYKWVGKITGIRVDPVGTGSGGTVGINFIHLIP